MDSTAQQKATMIGGDNLELSFKDLSLDAGTVGEDSGKILKWNLPLKELYKLACSFYKGRRAERSHKHSGAHTGAHSVALKRNS